MSVIALRRNDTEIDRRRAYAEIVAKIEAIGSARDLVSKAEHDLTQCVGELLRLVPSLASDLYWSGDIKVTTLHVALGVSRNEFMKFILPRTEEITCGCGDIFRVEYRSRTQISDGVHASLKCLACEPKQHYAWPARFPGRRDLDRLAHLRAMAYADYLRTPEWQKTRESALQRARLACQVCSSKHRLQVHHRTYDRFGSEQPRDLIVLCDECHDLFHRNGRLHR